MDFITTLIISSVLGGTALVPFVDFVAKDIKNTKITYAIALLTSVVVAFVVDYLQGKVMISKDPTTWFLTISTVFITSQTVFNLYWKNSLAREKFSQRISGSSTQSAVQAGVEAAQPGDPAQAQDATQG